ncbi:hypothetical protein Tco_0626840 [Tanacetum coccineum]|uniref:Uncharacterized protein n=1 Tax=Tanacetum coccineum TaxID=301880 RepID=A0ABQ4WKW6_9ASTR
MSCSLRCGRKCFSSSSSEVEMKYFTSRRFTRQEKDMLYVKKNKAYLLGKVTSKVGIESKDLSLPINTKCIEELSYLSNKLNRTAEAEASVLVIIIIEQRVKVDQKALILELKRRVHEEHCSDNLYAVSIKEDRTHTCPKLHSASTKERSICRIQKKAIRHIQVQVMEYSGI